MKRRTISPAARAAQYADSTQLATGLWVDSVGDVHVAIPELLELAGLPNTEQNREAVASIVHQVLSALVDDNVRVLRQKVGRA